MTTTSIALDKFYTSDAAAKAFIEYVKTFVDLDSFDNIIEPSAGAGALLNHLPSTTIGVDLMPERDDIIQSDFFDYVYPTGRNITVGNPPFGSRSKLAIEFFKHAALSSEVIAFIIPVTWEKFSIHKQLPLGWALIGNERLPEASFELDGKPYRVRCTMQVWVKQDALAIRKTSPESEYHPDFTFVKSSDEWDVAVYQSPPKTVLRGEEVKRSSIYIKCKNQSVIDNFASIKWQDKTNMYIIDGTKIPGVSPYHIIEVYNSVVNKRLTSRPTGANPWFDFVKVDECEFAIRQAYPKTVDKADIDGQSHYFIKTKTEGVREVFDSVVWQDEEGKRMLGGAKIPCLDKDTVVKFYIKYADLRKTEKEPNTHPDFIIKATYNPDAEFVVRCVRTKIIDDIEIFKRISNNNRVYSVQPLVPGVREVFDTINWEPYWQGVGMPQTTMPYVVQAYADAKAKLNKE